MRAAWLAPEVVQTSAMDCGPAALKCVLEGFGIAVSYGRLREACQTDVDGTSIDTMEEIARALGVDAEQVMIPREHLFLAEAEALPAIVVVRQPNGMTHFVVVWGEAGGRVQVMDPSGGRRWPTRRELLEELYLHGTHVLAADFRAWAESEDYLRPLGVRLRRLGLPDGGRARMEEALGDPGWRSLASLDAAARLVESMVQAGGVARGAESARMVEALLEATRRRAPEEEEPIPTRSWTARPGPKTSEGEEQVLLRGIVLVRLRGRRPPCELAAGGDEVSPELLRALSAGADGGGRALLAALREDGVWTPLVLALGLALGAGAVIVEALLFRGLLHVGRELPLPELRLGAAAVLLALLLLLLLLELPLARSTLGLGRRLEARLRAAFLIKIPRLAERYFSSRPSSDMAERSHNAHALREIPALGAELVRSLAGLCCTGLALVWVDPGAWPPALALSALSLVLPALVNRALLERDLRVRTHLGALGRFYLDALIGLVPIRAHDAERSVRREHEALLGEWSFAGRALLRTAVGAQGAQSLLGQVALLWLLLDHLARAGAGPRALLLLYWGFELLSRGREVGRVLREYPSERNLALRLLEPLGARDDVPAGAPPLADGSGAPAVQLCFEEVAVRAGGHLVLEGIELTVAAGEHVAVVGPSGAGKSSLVGLLLGWHTPSAGCVRVDGRPLDGAGLDRLRRETAWVDPAVQLWNRSFLDNLRYGLSEDAPPDPSVLEEAELHGVLERLRDGQQTLLGEGGGLVSGGEGQRVRLGRALYRTSARLVLLDEPFRGLDRVRRRALLARARRRWSRATLLCVTHDVAETLTFERVLVVEGGRVVEDGAPAELAAAPGSRYRALLDAEEQVQRVLWGGAGWRRLSLQDGRLSGEGR